MSKSILIVDDEQIIRNVLKRKLEQNTAYTVFTADDGEPGLEIFRQNSIDLVISDLLMVRMNGIELLRNLKQIDPKVPVIIITGYGTLDDAIEAIKLAPRTSSRSPSTSAKSSPRSRRPSRSRRRRRTSARSSSTSRTRRSTSRSPPTSTSSTA